MHRNVSQTGLVSWLALLGAAAALQYFTNTANSLTGQVGVTFLVLGFLVALASWFQMRLEDREEAERLELEDLARSKSSSALFTESSEDAFHARRAREQFEKWLVPAFSIFLFLLEAGAVWWFYRYLQAAVNTQWLGVVSSLAMAGLAGLALILFLLGTYASRLARYENHRLLRPAGSALLMGALICGVTALTEVAEYFGYGRYDRWAAWILLGVLALVTAESLFGLIFELFRPRVRGEEQRLVYESRLIGLLGTSGGLFKTAAQALDYQFGFKVSDTWLFKFLEQFIGKLVLFWLALLWLWTCFVFIQPNEKGLLERFGKPVGNGVLDPGMHLKLPWPIDAVQVFPAGELQGFNVGFIPDPAKEKDRVTLWTVPHYKEEFNLLVASRDQQGAVVSGDSDQAVPVNLVSVSIPIQFHIEDVRKWAYDNADAAKFLERLATREVVRYLANVDMDQLMSYGRLEAAQELQRRIQAEADKRGLGVRITFVGLQDIHPPIGNKETQVAAAFEQVIGAEAQKQALIQEAEGYRAETLPRAQAEAVKRTNAAVSLAAAKVEQANGQAAKFLAQRKAYLAAPRVFKERTYLETLAKAVAPARKIVVAGTNAHNVVQLNLEEKLRTDLLDSLPIESPNKK